MSVHGDAEQEGVSHPFPPALPLVCAATVLPFALQIAQSASLHSFKLVFLVSALNLSVAGIRTRDVPPDRAARVLSACQELEKVA